MMRLQSFPPSPAAFTHLIVVAEAPFITGVESGEWRGEGRREGKREKSEVLSNCELIRV